MRRLFVRVSTVSHAKPPYVPRSGRDKTSCACVLSVSRPSDVPCWINPSTTVVHLVDDRFAGGRLGAFSAPPGPFLVKIGPNESSLDAPVDAGPLPRPFWSATDVSFPLRPAAAWKAASMEGLTPCVARWVHPALPDQRSPRSENPRLSTRSHVA